MTAPIASPAAATVFTMVLTRGPISRVEIARRAGLSSAAVTKAARPLIEAGYLEELGATEHTGPGAGRPASPLDVRAEREFFVGVKITGDALIGVLTGLRARVLETAHRPLPRAGVERGVNEVEPVTGGEPVAGGTEPVAGGAEAVAGPADVESVVAALAGLVAELRGRSPEYGERCVQLGLSLAGDVDKASGLVRYSPFLGWRQVPLAALASDATGLDVTIENDVRALTTAEQWFGEGVGLSHFALVTVGVGIGCGLVVGDRVVAGARGVAGEIGHIPMGGDEPPCHCGGRGCVEAIAGTAAILAAAREALGRPELTTGEAVERATGETVGLTTGETVELTTGETVELTTVEAVERATGEAVELTIGEVVERAHGGDERVREVLARAAHAVGLAMAAMANLFGPARIVVTGDADGLASYEPLRELLGRTFAARAFGAAADCEIVLRPRAFEQWARGAAAVAIRTRFTLRDR
ncbi:ROK family protein [Nonomuraea sp. NPDC050663]|uniref:ROK family transcriptional regulator n=1 Tax=Nonomuraea sp. NPDC050663 TaxID=3364370 RepID=UPI0037B96030